MVARPLDNPSARAVFSTAHGTYRNGNQDRSLPKYNRFVEDASDMAHLIGEQGDGTHPRHDLALQTVVLQACGLPTTHA